MHVARNGQTATLLPDGSVLVVGGYNDTTGTGSANDSLSSAELYSLRTRTWTLTGHLRTARSFHTATLLRSGQVLVAGGYGPTGAPLASAEIYTPRTHRWTPTGAMTSAHAEGTATLLRDGRVLVAGGSTASARAVARVDLYDPHTGRWTSTGPMTVSRYRQTATLLPNGQVLVTGGRDTADTPLASAELYDPHTGRWTRTGAMHGRRWNHTATLLSDGQVLVAGATETTFADLIGHPNRGFATGPDAELYDPTTRRFTITGPMTTDRADQAAVLLRTASVLVVGGSCGGTYVNGKPTDARCLATLASATLLPNGTVLVAGGVGTSDVVLASAEVYTP